MSTAHALAELERSPELFDHIAHLQRVAEEEQRRREQFYNDLDEDTKAEFINGKVILHSPVKRGHLRANFYITRLLGEYVEEHYMGENYVEKCLIRCRRNDYEPDICFFSKVRCAELDVDQLIFPPPDLAIEILSPSTESNDRTLKLQDYARHGVGEYWIVDADKRMVEQYVLAPESKDYELKARLTVGARLTSTVLSGFTVPVAALFERRENQRALLALRNVG